MTRTHHRFRSALRDFLEGEAAGGILLIAAAAAALILANSEAGPAIAHFLHAPSGPVLTAKLGPMTPHLWINDGLMAIFFFLVGLEIKREFVDGQLQSWSDRRLPMAAALAGMAVPALLFLAIAGREPGLANGWAIPAATDIAFAIGVLALLGRRAPAALKLFLVTIAIVDDMGAVAIIAIAYTKEIAGLWLLVSAGLLGVMWTLGRLRIHALWPWLLLALLVWFAVLQSGVHATVAGVLAALMVPIVVTPGTPDSPDSPLHRLEHAIHPWSAYLIVPVFGFANAGVSFDGIGVAQLLAPLPLGIAAGLFFGKQLGIFGAVWLAEKTGFARRPGGAGWRQIWGVAMLCGIGFTMSLFIGELAFTGADNALLREEAKIGILMGSLLSALCGYLLLRFAPQRVREPKAAVA